MSKLIKQAPFPLLLNCVQEKLLNISSLGKIPDIHK